MTEHDEQAAVIEWARYHENQYPDLALLHAIPNGAWFAGKWGTAKKMLAEGLKKGVPDLCLPVVRAYPPASKEIIRFLPELPILIHHGLYIEMKTAKGRVRPEQQWWLDRLTEQGYKAVVCRGADEAIAVIKEYLGIG